jgi:hypothetical protein
MENIARYVTIKLIAEKKKREILYRQIQEVVLAHFTRSKLAVKRGKVQNLVADKLNQKTNARFRRLVTKALGELGIRAVCNQKTYLYRGLHDADALAKWEAKEAAKAERKRLKRELGSQSE